MAISIYGCIDLKSFYASVECVERGLDPFTTSLVVADNTRGRGAICLAITPYLKKLGLKNRCRLYEIPQQLPCIIAKPRMRYYMEYAARIYGIYLRYLAKEDIHVYSIDEAFMDFTPYLRLYHKEPKELAQQLMEAVFQETGISATAGIGTNLFLAKVALDIMAKKAADGIGILDEDLFKEKLWHHQPLTDIWNIGRGIAKRLAKYGVYDLYGITRLDPRLIYKEFGANGQFLLDHAYGREPCTIADILAYVPKGHSIFNGQMLFEDYDYPRGRIVLQEMVEASTLELVNKALVTGKISLSLGYSQEYGGRSSGSHKLGRPTDAASILVSEFLKLYDQLMDRARPLRRLSIGLEGLSPKERQQLELFPDHKLLREGRLTETILSLQQRFGKNSLLKGLSYQQGATGRLRNTLIGGHNGQ